ncbi:MAG: hypothetical protein A2Z34_00270 [Planctomycetes bacterium RBG_16_59_8]|nr:MAG: hypothetical protein A2Z34_00270 [Planctomycetes bacterium RBG_16_59_8]
MPHREPQSLSADVLVIGGGIAGTVAALEARRTGADTLLISLGTPCRNGASFYQSGSVRGIDAAPEGDRAAVETHFREIMEAASGHADERLVRVLAEEAPRRLRELVEQTGIPLKPAANGEVGRFRGCFSRIERAVIVENISDLAARLAPLLQESGVRVLERTAVVEIILREEEARGALGLTREGATVSIEAPSVLLAAGGGCSAFARSLTDPNQLGDSFVLAGDAGAKVRNLRFIQIMLGVVDAHRKELFPTAFFASGVCRLIDEQGADILSGRLSPGEIASAMKFRGSHLPCTIRDGSGAIDLAVGEAVRAGRRVYAEGSFGRREIAPFAHASNGGIVIDEWGESSVRGLFACGEAATGMHGADRLGGGMVAAALVFGARAGRRAAERAKRRAWGRPEISSVPNADETGPVRTEYRSLLDRVRRLLARHALIPRVLGELAGVAGELEQLRREIEESTPCDARAGWERHRASTAVRFGKMLVEEIRLHPRSEGPHIVRA